MGRPGLGPGEVGKPWTQTYYANTEANRAAGRSGRAPETFTNAEGNAQKIRYSRDEVFFKAFVRAKSAVGAPKEFMRQGATKGAAERAVKKAASDWTRAAAATTMKPTTTVEELAAAWLEHRRVTGKVKEGPLRESAFRQMEDAVRIMVLGRRKVRQGRQWVMDRPKGGIPHLKVTQCTTALLEEWLFGLEQFGPDWEQAKRDGRDPEGIHGLSTKQARSILIQMFDFAKKRGLINENPMNDVAATSRPVKQTRPISIYEARLLRTLVTPEAMRKSQSGRMRSRDLCEVIDLLLGTGCRIGEVLALRWCDLYLDDERPYVLVRGTMIEPRGSVPFHRSPVRKSDTRDPRILEDGRAADDEPDLTLFLPDAVVQMLRTRRARVAGRRGLIRAEETVFASRVGTPLSMSNIRTALRVAVAGTELDGLHPHVLRKLVSTVVERTYGMDAARQQMGHAERSLTGQVYVWDNMVGHDVRPALDQFFDPNWEEPSRRVVPRTSVWLA